MTNSSIIAGKLIPGYNALILSSKFKNLDTAQLSLALPFAIQECKLDFVLPR